MQKTKQIQFFITENGKSYIKDWLEKLDIETHSRILNNASFVLIEELNS
ncbi:MULTISPECIES: hypothetical protein [spotted fever group]|uniref:Uncharacterized protein n=1 Tax=Rickettsia tamurae subsp. buchneri TaxID=1462938 RepID=A0A8E1C017_9RICK|nr:MULTISPECIES: hypothetical protein [spotted fever group]EER22414.1 hypothetical protein REIS_1636 [Rickettsia endosymbiont of Ixodes scapularis]KDO03021.1 hypothetical protein REISMN_03935 [Rickettsia tamurae subsp. buchneri]